MKPALLLLILAACAAPPSDPQPAPTKAGWEQRIIQIPGHRMQAETETI